MSGNALALDNQIGIDDTCDTSLPVNPFEALKPHFGMLLGVQDFQTIDAYHRGKQWLHNAWLHRDGVVWGLEVSLDFERDEIRVEPGLALDALGREIYLPKPVCLNVPAWVEKRKNDNEFRALLDQPDAAALEFSVHVVIQFRACLARQVPALMEPCEGGSTTTAYSRIMESVEVLLRPNPAPVIGSEDRRRPYHRLRLLFNLEAPLTDEGGAVLASDQEVIDERDSIQGLALADQPTAYLDAFRQFAALDGIDLDPATSVLGEHMSAFPGVEPAPVILADLANLSVGEDGLNAGAVNNRIRDTHIATSTIQELLCGPLFRSGAAAGEAPGEAPPEAPADAGGPRIDPESVTTDSNTLSFEHSGPDLLRRSVAPGRSVFVSTYATSSGWTEEAITDIQFEDSRVDVVLDRAEALESELVRLVVKGTGPTPVIGANRVPLAGRVGGPPGSVHDGQDFVTMLNQET